MMRIDSIAARFICLAAVMVLPALRGFGQPTVDGRFVTSINGSTLSVKAQIKTDTGTDDLGLSTMQFTFNTSGLSFPASPVDGTDYVFHNFDDAISVFYANATTTLASANTISLNIELLIPNLGTVVTTGYMDVATVFFTITNASQSSNLTWSLMELFDGDNATQWTNGVFLNEDSPLPIQLASLTAMVVNQNDVRLDWTTLTETNNYGFEVQKSADSTNDYQTIPNSFIPGHGTTVQPHSYSYTDATASSGLWFYRLKQLDLDGTIHYTEGVQVDVTTDVEEKQIPTEFALDQNYPNPFNPSTVINFAIPQETHVKLEVYNMIGQRVATLADGVRPAGYYSVSFDATGLASGVYVYRFEAADLSAGSDQSFVETKKLIFLK